MTILKTNIENLAEDPRMIYFMTTTSGINASKADTTDHYTVDAWLQYEEENSKGELQKVLAVMTRNAAGERVKLQTISETFTREFFKIAEIMGNDKYAIIVRNGKTKGGRDYVTCELYFE